MRAILLAGFSALAFTLCVGSGGRAAPARSPYATYHADMLYVTPYVTQVAMSIGDYQPPPSPGNEYLLVWIQAINRNDVPMYTTDREFHIVSADGQLIDPGFSMPDPSYSGHTLVPGGIAKGKIAFEVRKGTHRTTMRWVPDSHWTDLTWPTFSWALRY